MLDPRLLRASMGVCAVTDPCSEPAVFAATMPPPTPGTVPGVNEPPRKGSPLAANETGLDIRAEEELEESLYNESITHPLIMWSNLQTLAHRI